LIELIVVICLQEIKERREEKRREIVALEVWICCGGIVVGREDED
jgi:hypothetical protein